MIYDPSQDYYFCDSCGLKRQAFEMDSMACSCGGGFRTHWNGGPSLFDPHYCHELKSYVSSWSEKERVAKKQGCVILDGKKINQYRKERKNMPDITRAMAKRDGYYYDKKTKKFHV